MSNLICKHFLGWLEHENMSGGAWLDLWRGRVKSENAKGDTVVVFHIPKGDTAIIIEIEAFIQNRIKNEQTNND